MGTVQTSPWAAPRRRAEVLREEQPFAADLLELYLALLEVWEESWEAAQSELSPSAAAEEVAAWSARRVLPRVVSATAEAGPTPLVEQLLAANTGDVDAAEQLLLAWLRGEELSPVEQYVARSTVRGPLAVTTESTDDTSSEEPSRTCPRCGGPPQLSFRQDTGDELANGARRLQCARCAYDWPYPSATCAACGESRGGRLTCYAEERPGIQVQRGETGDARFPHLRIESCGTCKRYLIDIDQSRNPRVVPEVDELTALPLDLYATEHGLTKITPNIMGF